MINAEIKKLTSANLAEFNEVIRLFEDVFEMKDFKIPEQNHLQALLEKDDFYVFAAFFGNRIVGALTAYTLIQYYSVRPLVYIYDLAVKTEFQRQGIGKNLIAAITNYCRETGIEEVFVQADRIDDHAVKFYHSTGATAEDVIHFYYPLN